MKTLKKNYEFRNVLTRGVFYKGKYIEIYILKNKKGSNFIGIAVQKKIATAVGRNRIKRVIRESYRSMENAIKNGYDIVILWRKNIPIENAKYFFVKEDIKKLFENANIIKDLK